jgi:uncharacterized membrane protein YqjE
MLQVENPDDRSAGPASVSTSLEHLVTSSQRVLSTRIELALLEGREILSQSLEGAALTAIGVLLAVAGWMAVTGAGVAVLIPESSPALRLLVFGLSNVAGALFCAKLIRDARSKAGA